MNYDYQRQVEMAAGKRVPRSVRRIEQMRAPKGFVLYFDEYGREYTPPLRPMIVPEWFRKQS